MKSKLGLLAVVFTTMFLSACQTPSFPVSEDFIHGESTNRFAKQTTQAFTFPNGTGKEVNDLHVVFKKADIEVLELGPFERSSADDKGKPKHSEIVFWADEDIAKGGSAKVSFQSHKHHDFRIDKWWWTDIVGEREGDIHEGEPSND